MAGGAAAVGFATFAAEQIEGALDHGLRALKPAQGVGQGDVSTPELLTQTGEVAGQSESIIYYQIQIASSKFEKIKKPAGQVRPRLG